MINTYEHIHWKYAGKSPQEINVYKEYYNKVFSELNINRIHDCTCGSGALTFPLIYLGYNVSGSDISEIMVDHAKDRVKSENLNNDFFVADLRNINNYNLGKIDCLISTGNSLAHVNNEDFFDFITSASRLLSKNSYLYFDTRNWDKIVEHKQRFLPYRLNITDERIQQILQVWDYNADNSITFNILIHDYTNDGYLIGTDYQFVPPYYPITYKDINEILSRNGFRIIKRYNFDLFGLWKTDQSKNIDFIESEDDLAMVDWYSVLAIKE